MTSHNVEQFFTLPLSSRFLLVLSSQNNLPSPPTTMTSISSVPMFVSFYVFTFVFLSFRIGVVINDVKQFLTIFNPPPLSSRFLLLRVLLSSQNDVFYGRPQLYVFQHVFLSSRLSVCQFYVSFSVCPSVVGKTRFFSDRKMMRERKK